MKQIKKLERAMLLNLIYDVIKRN